MKENDKPNCCKKGNKFIQLCIDDDFKGWAIMVDLWEFGDRGTVPLCQAFYCPFCGKKLEVVNEK